MPTISAFFGIVIRMYYDEHNRRTCTRNTREQGCARFPWQYHQSDLRSRTALRLVRDWIDLHLAELEQNRDLAALGTTSVKSTR